MLKLLCLEDSQQDVEIMCELLKGAGYDLIMDCTAIEKEFVSFLRGSTYDIILSDFKLPGFDGFTALRWAMEICPNVPFICVSGTIGEEKAVELLKQGAVDYVIKDRLARLPAAIKRALDEAKEKESRRRAEAEVRESELKLRTVADFTYDWEYWEKENREVAYISPSCERITGYSPKEFIADPALLEKIIHPGDVDHVKKYRERVFTTEHKHDVDELEFRIIHKNGSVVHIYHVCRPIFDASDQYHGRRISNRDITERKRAEEELKKSESKFRAIFDNTSDGIFLVDLNVRKFFICNAMCTKMLGYTQEEFLTLDIDDIHPNEDLTFINEQIGKFSKGEEGIRSDIRFKRKDGSIFVADLRPVILTIAEKKYLLINFIDITERKQVELALQESEEKYRTFFNTSRDCVFITSVDGNWIDLNDAAVELFGYSSREELMKVKISSLYAHEEDRAKHISVIIEHGYTKDYPVDLRKKNGVVVHTLITSAVQRDADSHFIGFMGTIRDVTERKRAEEELTKSEEKYRVFFENVQDVYFEISLDSIILEISPSVEVVSKGQYKQADLIGRSMFDIYADIKDHDTFMAALRKTGSVADLEVLLKNRDGSYIFCSFSAKINFNAQGQPEKIIGSMHDITERRLAEEELKFKNIILSTQQEVSIDGILVIDENGKILSYNHPFVKMWGILPEVIETHSDEIVLKSVMDKLEGPQQFIEKVEYLYAHKNETSREEIALKDGRILDRYSAPMLGVDAKYYGRVWYFRDITERKRAEEALRETRDYLESLLSFANAPIMVWDNNNTITRFNLAFEKLTGYTMNDVLGKHPDILFPVEMREKLSALISRTSDGENLISVEIPIRSKDGSVRIVLWNSSNVYSADGTTIIATIAHGQDITERKQAEEALIYERNLLKSLMDNTTDHIYFKDMNSRFIRVSKAQADSFGIGDPVEAVGKTDFAFFTEQHARPAYANEQEIMKTGRLIVNLEEKETWPNGRETWVSTTKVPLRDLNGKIIGTFGISRDITEQKKMQNQLLQTQKVQSIGTLAGGIAHDFNNILGIILAYISVLERSEGDKEKVSKSISAITQAVGRGAALVRQILTFARQTGVVVKPMCIPDLIYEIINMLKETFPKVIEFHTTIENNVPFINADHSQMHQVLLNLCVNARDAMPSGGIINIEVKTVTSESLIQQFPEARNSRYVFIGVSDTGIGMDDATKSRIFDPFFTTKEQGKGTGLGLSVVHGVIQEHHGFISVESTVGQGTTFSMYLPVPKEEKKIPDVQKTRTEGIQGGTETILFVEDEELLREIVQSSLESNGYKVLLATNGREAIEIYKKQYNNIALVLSDMGLPKLGGIDLYAMLKDINPNIKIIFASGLISLETRSELIKEGAKGLIQKPYNVNEVLQMVREVLDEKER